MSSGTGARVFTAAITDSRGGCGDLVGAQLAGRADDRGCFDPRPARFLSIAAHVNLPSYRLWTYVAAVGIIAQQFCAARRDSVATVGQGLLDRALLEFNLDLVLFADL